MLSILGWRDSGFDYILKYHEKTHLYPVNLLFPSAIDVSSAVNRGTG